MKERIVYIDQLKGLAIMLVVMGHINAFCLGEDNVILQAIIASLDMPLFFFLSGMFMKREPFSRIETVDFIKRKTRSLLFPFLTVGFIYTFYAGRSLSGFWADEWKYGYWFLLVLWIFSIVFIVFNWLVHFIIKRMPGIYPICVDIILIFVFVAIAQLFIHFFDDEMNLLLSLYRIPKNLAFFLLGGTAVKYGLIDKILSNRYLYSVNLLVYCGVFLMRNYLGGIFLCGIPAIMVCLYLFYTGISQKNVIMIFLNFVGGKTLDIYIFHYFFLLALNIPKVGKYMGYLTGNGLVIFLICIFFSVIITLLCLGVSKVISGSNILSTLLLGKKFERNG